jgi:aspartyl-tRNA synthetase
VLRTHHLGELSDEQLHCELRLCGWVERVRGVGGIIFVVLRDRYGNLQLSLDRDLMPEGGLSREDCICVHGKLALRPEKDRTQVLNGAYELQVSQIEILNSSEVPPFVVEDREEVNEDLRLRYRYLDLRRPSMVENLSFRHQVSRSIRASLDQADFLEVETPLLMKSTPEGARDFLVPSRIYPGEFYALPQSPQIYKQLIQVAGLDRYYQFARCFRDEDARQERQLVHTQVDLEMSFVTEDDVHKIVEGIFHAIFRDVLKKDLTLPFERLGYAECMARFGTDKPDLRFGLELQDLKAFFEGTASLAFDRGLEPTGRIAGIVIPGGASFSRKDFDSLTNFVKTYGASVAFYCKVTEEGFSSGASRHIPLESVDALMAKTGASLGDALVFVAESESVASQSLGHLRNHIARILDERSPKGQPFIERGVYRFLWVTDFPLFEFSSEENRWIAMHHMFTMPREQDLPYFKSLELDRIHGRLYDLVLNGVELGSGSIRIHHEGLQKQVFEAIGMTSAEMDARFGFFLNSLRYGAPPHGGIALGLARLVMTLLELENMRDVIAFPNASSSRYLLDDSPTSVTGGQLNELHLRSSEE